MYTSTPTGQPKAPIKTNTTATLAEVLNIVNSGSATVGNLFYEIYDVDVVELDTKKLIKITWLNDKFKELVHSYQLTIQGNIRVLVLKEKSFKDLEQEVISAVPMEGTKRVRFWEVAYNRCKDGLINLDRPVCEIKDWMTLYAEVRLFIL